MKNCEGTEGTPCYFSTLDTLVTPIDEAILRLLAPLPFLWIRRFLWTRINRMFERGYEVPARGEMEGWNPWSNHANYRRARASKGEDLYLRTRVKSIWSKLIKVNYKWG